MSRLRRVNRLRKVRDAVPDSLAKRTRNRDLHRQFSPYGDVRPTVLGVAHEITHSKNSPSHSPNHGYFEAIVACTARGLGLRKKELLSIIDTADSTRYDRRSEVVRREFQRIIDRATGRRVKAVS